MPESSPTRTLRSIGTGLAAFWIAWASASPRPAEAQEPTPELREKVARLVGQLDAPAFAQREKATEQLIELDDAARPILEATLKDTAARLTLEQRERIELILKDGPLPWLESRSHLEPADLDLLREFRAGQIERNRAYDAFRGIERIVRASDTRDEALALIVRTLLTRSPADDNRQNDGIGSYQILSTLRQVLDHKEAGPKTGRAMAQWVASAYIPLMQRPADAPQYSDLHTADDVALRVLLADQLPLDTFERLLKAACAITPVRPSGYWDEPRNGLGARSVVGFSYSRHTTSEHLGRLIQTLIRRAGLAPHYNYSPFGPAEPLQLLLASPKLTEQQARAVATWLFGRPQARPPYTEPVDVTMRWLTNRTIWTPDDTKGYSEPGPQNPEEIAFKRWQTWLADNADKPLLVRPTGPSCRYILATMLLTDPDRPSLEITIDAQILPGVGYLLGKSNSLHETQMHWVRIEDNPGRWQMSSAGSAPQNARHLQILSFSRNGANGGTEMCRLGQVYTRDHGRYPQESGRVEYATFQLLVDPAQKDTVPSPEQLRDPAWWGRRAVDAFAATHRELASANEADIDGEGHVVRANLAPALCRTGHIEKALRDLLSDPVPRVVAKAALQLARWKATLDAKPLLPLLESNDATTAAAAAETFSCLGRPEGVHWLIARVKKEGLAGPAMRILMRHGDVGRFDPEQKARLAAELITAILPPAENPSHPAVCEWFIVQRWSGFDFGYQVGADPAENTKALVCYHDWAKAPRPPENAPTTSKTARDRRPRPAAPGR